jgi:5-methylcytosine-specific restriction endonuclease McrA
MAAYMRERRKETPEPLVPKTTQACAECGEEFLADKRQRMHCSPACRKAGKRRADLEYQVMHPERHSEANRKWRQRHPDRVREKARVYRARKMNATIEPVCETEIFQRDQWTCGICSQSIDPSLKWPDPMSPSIDHIVPLFRGGAHSPANCQASHLRCNVRKGASLTPE